MLLNQNRLERSTRKEWLLRFALDEIPGMGCITQKRLYDTYGTAINVAEAFLNCDPGVARIPPLKRKAIVDGLRIAVKNSSVEPIDGHLVQSQGERKRNMMGYPDAEYPPLLKEITDPPPFFWYVGDPEALEQPCVSIVGTRRASAYGRRSAYRLAFELASKGITIISGLAFGIDKAAHEGALDAGGKTVAVLGGGLDHLYPKSHAALAKEVERSGCLISEFRPDHQPRKSDFPRRNRIISGLSSCTVVVEAFEKAGALVTARLCIDQQRELFCVPGRIDEETSSGTNKLLAESAGALLYSFDQIVDLLVQSGTLSPSSTQLEREEKVGRTGRGLGREPQSVLESSIVSLLQSGPVSMDTINVKLEHAGDELWSALLFLECDGIIRQTPLGAYELIGPRK